MESRLRVLCVDGEPVSRLLMVEMLCARGVDAQGEADPLAALERLRAEPFDVLVTDLSMPIMGGIELVSRAVDLSRPPGCVLVTARSGSSLDLSGLPLGTVAGVVSKPFSHDELWEVVDQAARSAKSRGGSSSEPAATLAPVSLLLVEDDAAQSELVSALLERAGFACDVTVCGRLDDALELLATQSFGMALVDLNLPDARGLDVVRRIRTVSPETPVVVLSEESSTWGDEAALDLGAQEVLLKSEVNMTDLLGAVQRALSRRSAERQATNLAFRDARTGLFNARYFLRRLSEAVALSAREGKPCAVFLLDLDGFKPVNDEYGHAMGDAALKEIAGRLKDALRDYDTLARLGGDELVVLVQGVEDRNVLAALAQRFVELVAKPMRFEHVSITLGASVGVAVAPECASEPGTLLRVADHAMYAAKAAGKGTVRFAVGGATDSAAPSGVGFPPAVSAPRYWLHTLVDARDETRFSQRLEIASLEDPERTTTDVLRSLARSDKDVDTIVDALRAARRTAPDSTDLCLTIPSELFGTRLLDALREAGLSRSLPRITFEAPAPALLAGNASQRVMLQAFQDAGFNISMRDFGTAAMRPDLLASLPLRALRLDARIVTRAAEGDAAQRLLRGLVTFGQALGFEIVVDDLRNDQQCRLALEAGCDRVLKRHTAREL